MIVQLVNQWNIFGFKSAKVIDSELPLFPKRYWYEFWKRPNFYNLQENNVPTGHVLLSCIYGCKEKSLDLIQWGQRTIYVSFIPWTGSLSARGGIEDEMMPRSALTVSYRASLYWHLCPRFPALIPPKPTQTKELLNEQTQPSVSSECQWLLHRDTAASAQWGQVLVSLGIEQPFLIIISEHLF